MKSCPTCNRTFEDTFTFCLADGSLLDAPFDPQATRKIPEPRQTEPPPTEVLHVEETKQEIPPTIASPQPEQKPEELASTIAAPAPAFESPQIKDSLAQPMRKSHRLPWVIGGILVLATIAVIFFLTGDTAAKHAAAGEQLWMQSNDYAGAEKEYRQAIKLEPNNPRWYWLLSLMLEQQNKYVEAEAALREAVRLSPKDFTYLTYLAGVLEKQGKNSEAEQEFRNMIQLAASESEGKHWLPMLHWRLGIVLEEEKRLTEAEAEYREAIRLKPDDTTYRDYLKRFLAAHGRNLP